MSSSRRAAAGALFTALLTLAPHAPAWAQAVDLTVEAPPSLGPVAAQIRRMDFARLAGALGQAGLAAPPGVRITLIAEEDARARAAAPWIAGQAFGTREIVIFPARVGTYPHNSLETLVWHEFVHVALSWRAGGRPLPRWFHEGVAVSVEAGWGVSSQVRLMLAAARRPTLDALDGLFASDTQPENATAYLLAAALISDVRRRHGPAVPGAIAAHVGAGLAFDAAFAAETGETPQAAAMRAWAPYRRWASWIPVVTGGSFVWIGILLLAFVAFAANLRRRARQRRAWDREEEEEEDDQDGEG